MIELKVGAGEIAIPFTSESFGAGCMRGLIC
jgi:hypothetical protein